jgi:hypothetical protein
MKWVVLTFPDLSALLAFAHSFSFDVCKVFPLYNTFSGIVTEGQLTAASTNYAATLHCYVDDVFGPLQVI